VSSDTERFTDSEFEYYSGSTEDSAHAPSIIDKNMDNKIYQCIQSIIGIERGMQLQNRADLDLNHLGMARRFSQLLAPLSTEDKQYWRTHLRKQRAQHGLRY